MSEQVQKWPRSKLRQSSGHTNMSESFETFQLSSKQFDLKMCSGRECCKSLCRPELSIAREAENQVSINLNSIRLLDTST